MPRCLYLCRWLPTSQNISYGTLNFFDVANVPAVSRQVIYLERRGFPVGSFGQILLYQTTIDHGELPLLRDSPHIDLTMLHGFYDLISLATSSGPGDDNLMDVCIGAGLDGVSTCAYFSKM